jgi:hypothetical protein
MKKIIVVVLVLVAFVTNVATALTADSTKAKVKEFSKKEYTVIAGTDTTKVIAGDSVTIVTFSPSDKLTATGKVDVQMVGGVKTKIKEVTANGKKFWIKDDVDLDCAKCNTIAITMWCDEDQSSDPISAGYYGLIGLVVLLGGFVFWKSIFRG